MKFLYYPTDNYRVNQPFGENYNGFYKELGMLGHNGIDVYAPTGTFVRAAHDGKVIIARTDSTGGKEVSLVDKTGAYRTVYYHLLGFTVKVDQDVKVGDIIGIADNTGKYTTGSHLHFGLREVRKNDWGGYDVLNVDNGYWGSIDPEPFWTGLTAKDAQSLIQVLQSFNIQVGTFLTNLLKK